jgi:hypothetical protein
LHEDESRGILEQEELKKARDLIDKLRRENE